MRSFKKIALSLLILTALIAFLNIPTTTRQGINGIVTDKKIPLYVKACGFLYRDYRYKDLSRHITSGIEGDKERVTAIYEWTVEKIKRQPRDFIVIDDHVWDIIARRYGEADQMADVFTTLASYAGYEAFWISPQVSRYLILSFVKFDDKWHMFDVYNKRSFITGEELKSPTPYGLTYSECLDRVDKSIFKSQLRRPDRQKILMRPLYELKRLFRRKVNN